MFGALWRFFKALFKLYITALLVLCCLIALPFLREPDDLNEMLLSYYDVDYSTLGSDNAYIAMVGLNAPANVESPYNWGLSLVQQDLQEMAERAQKELQGQQQDLMKRLMATKQLLSGEGTQNQTLEERIAATPGHILFQGDAEEADCWILQRWESAPPACGDRNKIHEMAELNKLMLKRYMALSQHAQFMNAPGLASNIEQMQKMHKLFLAYLISESPAAPQAALDAWLANASFLKRALSGQSDFAMRSILMAMYKQTQQALPSLLSADITLIPAYEPQLLQVLAPFTPQQMNFELALKTDFAPLRGVVDRLDAYNRNKFFDYHIELVRLSRLPAAQFVAGEENFTTRYRRWLHENDWRSAALGAFANMLIRNHIPMPVIAAMHDIDARNRMLSLYVLMKSRGVEQNRAANFLATSPVTLHDPFTGKPFAYDAEKNAITYQSATGREALILN